ncbi:SdrD B-like domain-containing protein [Runella sp. MFBS21]|uniref:SdrD B-like domain-containing protein n=1 Tax=Runella sp. MFBS21 TaxID=3034018 RepID=UPI0023F77100|nr:SdrD B-like domain-containing protein [Runella sp. MFBS21]MDF7820551.1 SdrD B-like domain-containing protein [Runella sp. MFBS21]
MYTLYKRTSLINVVYIPKNTFSILIVLLLGLLGKSFGQTVEGTVFRDFNADGQITNTSTFNEIGVPNILVSAFRADGSLADSVRTASDGSYVLTVGSTAAFRIEFKDFLIGDFEGPFAVSGSHTSVQFVNGGSTGINLGINYPANYCETETPQMVTTCFVAVNTAIGSSSLGDRDALVGAAYNATDDNKVISHYATVNDIGSAWGLTYKRETKQLFSTAFTKRHIGFTPKGPGAIFVTNINSLDTTTTEFFNFGTVAGVDMHTDVPTELSGGRLDSYDIPAYDAVGKVGLGDIDISDDGKTLWLTNLSNRKLYSLDIATKDTVSYTIPNPCAGKSYRPFATKFYRNKVYVGVVCTREDASTKTDSAGLAATVYAFENGTFSPVLNFPLTYVKGASNADVSGIARAELWRPWIQDYNPDRTGPVSFPQAWLTDIEFDVDGSMLLGIRDRFGDQVGYQNRKPIQDDPDFISGITPGEVLRAGPCGPNGTWLIEQNGSVCGSTPSSNQSSANGPGNGKYYWGDRVQNGDNHRMSSQGGIAILAGSGKLAMTAVDPTDVFNTGGIKRLINSNGNKDGNATGTSVNTNGGVVLYASDAFGYGKANGVGDLEILCAPQPIEIGNRIWKDLDKDGIQDANEPGIDGVTVTLCDSTGATIASAQTANGGQYYFSSANTSGGPAYVQYEVPLKTNTKYIIKIENYATQTALLNCIPSTANAGNDNIDSDFEIEDSNLKFTLITGGAGENDFKIDAGFIACVKPNAGNDTSACAGVSSIKLKSVVSPESWIPAAGNPLTINATTGVITGAALNTPGTYSFILLYEGSSTCADTVNVTIRTNVEISVTSPQNAEVCADEGNAQLAVNVSGGNWASVSNYPGVVINPSTGAITGLNTPGIYKFVYLVDTTLYCLDTVSINVKDCCKQPSWEITVPATCAVESQTYSVSFFVNNKNGIIKTNYGTITGSNPYSVTNIPNNFNLVITDSLNASCVFDTTITAPDCSCPQVLPLTPNASACIGDTLPTLRVSLAGSNTNGVTIEWYSSSTGGTALATGLSFKPAGIITQNDTFYVQLNNTSGPCIDLDRAPVVVTALDCQVDITLKKFVNKKIAAIGDTLVFTIKVWNQADNNATGVEVLDSLPNTVAFVNGSFLASRGSASFTNNVITWNIGNIAANGDTVTLTYKIKAVSQGLHFNTAQVSKTNEKDKDSTPGNNDETEDDIDRQCFTVPVKLCPGEVVEASVPAKYTNVQWFLNGQPVNAGNTVLFSETGNYTFTATNNSCPAEGCCPIIIEPGDNCCPENICIPFTISKSK